MSRLNINSWSFKQRLYLITIAASLSIVIYLISNIFIINEYENTVRHISGDELFKLYQISHSYKELSSVHTELFNLFSSTSINHNEQELYLVGGKLIDRLDTLHNNLVKVQGTEIKSMTGEKYDLKFDLISEELMDYRNAASVSIEMLSVNTGLSERYMIKAASRFNHINSHLSQVISKVTDHIGNEMKEQLHLIKKAYWPMSIMIVLLTIFMFIIFYKIIAALSTNFHFIDKSLDDLRAGNTNIDIPVYTDNNEMGKIYSSLDKFRASLIDLRQSQHELSEKNRLLLEESERRLLTQQELTRSLIELSRAMDAAEASSKAKSLFMANISHEIRTPLNAVLGMAQVLRTTTLDETQMEYTEILYTQGQHLLQLLNRVLDFSKMESGKLKLEYQAFKLDNLLEEVTSLFKNQPSNEAISLKVEIAADVDNTLFGDSLRIRQILINLLSNAYKFTQKGEIIIHIENITDKSVCEHSPSDKCPKPTGKVPCDWHALYFSVTDTGIGINQDKQHYIFDNFTQADESMTREYGGTGIGLAICKQLVELMDGEIGVSSESGQGACFWFRICLPDSDPAKQLESA